MKIGKNLRKAILPLAAVAGLGGTVGCDQFSPIGSLKGENAELKVELTKSQTEADSLKNEINRYYEQVSEQLRRINDPEYGTLKVQDGENQSVNLGINTGRDFKGDSLKISRNGEKIATLPSTSNDYVDSLGVEDGEKYVYTVSGLDSLGFPTEGRFGASFVPFEDAKAYQLKIDVRDAEFDKTGKITVKPTFETHAKGDSVEKAKFWARSLADSSVVDSVSFTNLDKALSGFEMNAGLDSVYVFGFLDLARGNTRGAKSDTTIAVDDMPQLVMGSLDGRKTIQGYQMATTDFRNKAQADSLVSKLSEDPSLGGRSDTWVGYEGSNPNDLVGQWLLPNGSLVKTQEEAFKSKKTTGSIDTVEAITESQPWSYNNSYDFYDLAAIEGSGEEAFRLNRGNTVAGGLVEIGRRHGVSINNKQARELSDEVVVYDGLTRNPIKNPDLGRLPVGTIVHLTPEVRDFLYGTQSVAQDPVYGSRLESEVGNLAEIAFEELQTADLNQDGVIGPEDRDLYVEGFYDIDAADLRDCREDETIGTEINTIDFYQFVDTLKQGDLIDRRDGSDEGTKLFAQGFDSFISGDLCGGETPKVNDGVKRNLASIHLLSTGSFDNGISYDRLLDNGFGLGAEVRNIDGNLGISPRLSYGNNDFRGILSLGHNYFDHKVATDAGISGQFRLSNTENVYGEFGVSITDVGRWKDQVLKYGNGFDATEEYGEAKVGIGYKF